MIAPDGSLMAPDDLLIASDGPLMAPDGRRVLETLPGDTRDYSRLTF